MPWTPVKTVMYSCCKAHYNCIMLSQAFFPKVLTCTLRADRSKTFPGDSGFRQLLRQLTAAMAVLQGAATVDDYELESS